MMMNSCWNGRAALSAVVVLGHLAGCFAQCDTGQYLRYGSCTNCPAGKVGLPDFSNCVYCASGSVKSDETSTATCISADGVCGSSQYTQYGGCRDCPAGKVATPDHTTCIYCTLGAVTQTGNGGSATGNNVGGEAGPGRVKSTPGGSNAVCVDADGVCGSSQYSQYGGCRDCPAGKVATPDHDTCIYCTLGAVTQTGNGGSATGNNVGGEAGPGRVKTDSGDSSNEVCVDADGVCGSSQYSQYGGCRDCPAGKVATPEHDTCIYCTQSSLTDTGHPDHQAGPGRVKNEPGGSNSFCLPINPQNYARLCGFSQYARYGGCANCPAGQVATFDHSDCVYCSQSPGVYTSFGRTGAGSIKVWEHWPAQDDEDEKHGTCETAVGRCGSSQYARYGVCTDCPAGQVANNDHSGCVYCTQSTETDTAGGLAGPGRITIGSGANAVCGAAAGVCGSSQYARYGSCTQCGNGQVATSDHSTCTYCTQAATTATAGGNAGPGRIKNQNGINDAICTDAAGICGSSQYTRYGACTQCGNGQVATSDHSTCIYCTQSVTTATAGGDAGPGRIKNQNGIDNAICRDAVGECGSSEYARYGACTQCGNGQVATTDHSTCIYCTQAVTTATAGGDAGPGRVKTANNVPGATCTDADGFCDTDQYARYGACTDCSGTQVANSLYTGCEDGV